MQTYKEIHQKFPDNLDCKSWRHFQCDVTFWTVLQIICNYWFVKFYFVSLGLKFLIRLFNDQGLVNEGKEYANKLNKLEKNLVQKEQV